MPEPNELLPGVKALQKYLEDHNFSISAFARKHQLDASELSKILRGERGSRMTVISAAAIHEATNGIVHWRLWLPPK